MAKGKTRIVKGGLNGSVTHLLHRALQLALDYHAEAAGPAALTQRQFTVLSAAAQVAEGLTQNDLVRATGIDRSTLADLVGRMMAKGLLERERSTLDARANTVTLSVAGRSALEAGAGAASSADDRLLALLSPKKRETFLKILTGLAEAADEPAGSKRARKAPAKVEKPSAKKKKLKKVKAARTPKAGEAEAEVAA